MLLAQDWKKHFVHEITLWHNHKAFDLKKDF